MSECDKGPEDVEVLRKGNAILQHKLEIANQELHDCKRNLKTAEALQIEYEEEIRILQSEESDKSTKLEKKIHQLEENIITVKSSCNERLNCLEKELMTKQDEVDELKRELEVLAKISDKDAVGANDSVFEEVSNLKELNQRLLQENEELKESCGAIEKQMFVFKEECMVLQGEVSNLKESLECKRDELTQANSLLQTLQDDVMSLKSELDMFRSKPLDDKSQGNSLFAEVNDRRVELQQNYNLVKSKYMEMKRERALHLNQISSLHNENAALVAQWESEVTGRRNDENMILDSYKAQIETMNIVIESYKKELAEKAQNFEKITPVEMKFFENMLNTKKQEIESLRQKLSERSVNQTLLSHDLGQARREIWKWKSECSCLKSEIGKLKAKLEAIQLKSSPLQEKINFEEDQLELKPEVRPIMKIHSEPDDTNEPLNKENFNGVTTRKVKFNQETEEPKITNRSAIRRGVKTINAKPMHFSSLPKKE